MNNLAGIVIAALLALGCQNVSTVKFYVSPDGNDAASGAKGKPFATLERTRDAVRELRKGGPLGKPVTVFVRGGVYPQNTSLELGPQDSGTDALPVVWQAARREEARLTGGVELPANRFQPIADEKILARLDAAARDMALQIDLSSLGVKELGEYPEVFRGSPQVPELFFNDQRMTLARWPNDGWTTISKIVESGSTPREGEKPDRPGTFEYTGDRPARWDVASGVWLMGYWCYDWYDEAIQVKTVDREKRQITLSRPALYSVKQGNPSPRRYCALNLLEELDRPGEYYIDRSAGRLYFWPPADMKGARITLSTLPQPVLVLKDAENVIVRGFTVEACLGDGIEVSGGRGVRIESCTVRNARQLGIRVTGGAGHRVVNCEIHDTGTGGLVLEGGDRKTLTPAGHEAVNNHIWQFSRLVLSSAYGLTLGGVGNRAAHNLIHDAPHQAVSIQGNDHVFEYNVVHDVCTASDDCGALYKGRNPSCRGNVIRYNLWRDIGGIVGHGTAAIYFDDGDGGDTVMGNVFYRCGHPGKGFFGTVFSHGGHDILAENNIFIECERPLGSAPWGDGMWKETVEGGRDCGWQDKLLKEVDITKPPYTTRYPSLAGFMDPKPGQPRVNRAKNNLLVRCGEASRGNWKYGPQEIWSTDKDPGFVDAAHGNFQLRPDSEVFKRLPGFQPIPFERIGRQKSADAAK